MTTVDDMTFLHHAVALARANVAAGGRPFGAVVVRDGVQIAEGVNTLHRTLDPAAHAELNALRAAAQALHSLRLEGCTVYASGQPCPMCLAAMRMAGIVKVLYANSNADGERWGLSTAAIYADLAQPPDRQSMPCMHIPLAPAAGDTNDLYAAWHAAQAKSVSA